MHSDKAALRGEPSYVWRDGQRRRLKMILDAAPDLTGKRVLVDGCGVGSYVHHLQEHCAVAHGLDIEFDRLAAPVAPLKHLTNAVGEYLPYADNAFALILSHEVLEHVQDDRLAAEEIARVLEPGGRCVVFVPNRGYPFETHGIYWKGNYKFGNKPFVNYLPTPMRDKLAPHVKVYSKRDLKNLFADLPLKQVSHQAIYGGYDNIIARLGENGRRMRNALYKLEGTPLQWFGLSHFAVWEKV